LDDQFVYNRDMAQNKKLIYAIIATVAIIIGAIGGFVMVHSTDMPQIEALENFKPNATTRVFADNGEMLAEFYMENRIPVGLSIIPPHVIKAFLATEDPRFYSHSGIDVSGVLRAMLSNIRAGKVVQGGSSITQQLAKLLFLEPEKTLTRKIKEALIALQIERRYSKDEILTLYLNQVYLGNGAYGVEAASERYFGKHVSRLTLAEGAMLAGLPAAPNKYSPINNLERAYARRMHVLKRMAAEGFITEADLDAANQEPIEIKPAKNAHGFKAPYFVEYVRQRLEEKFGSTTLYKGGLNVYTTLNLKMQEMAEAAMAKDLEGISKRHPRKDKEIQGAFIAIEPHSGYIKAMIGGNDFAKSEFNRSTQALRQPGSSFKPIVFAAALDNGFRPDSIMVDGPVSYPGAKPGASWRPTNYENKFEGPVTLRHALAKSINVVAVKLMSKVGIDTTINYARQLGIKSELSPYLPLALGASDVTLMEMTNAYAVFDNSGVYTTPSVIEKITDREGGLIEDNVPATRQALSPDTAAAMTDLLQGVVKFGTGYEARSLGRPAAGKTGTTSSYNDAWFIGYIPSMVVGVWVGYDDHKPIGNRETGAKAALPAWLEFMKNYAKEYNLPVEDFPAPPLPGFNNRTGSANQPSPATTETEGPVDEAPAGLEDISSETER